jgi:hypothetical protein
MARNTSDREDLLEEATALRPRVELEFPGRAGTIVAGRRQDGRLSLYFGPDPVYHFNELGQLRRAYVGGDLYRSQGITLARLKRVQDEQQSQLLRHDLERVELTAFFEQMHSRINGLAQHLARGECRVLRSIPPDAVFLPDLSTALSRILSAASPLARALKK